MVEDDDSTLWERVIATITPIKKRTAPPPDEAPPPRPPRKKVEAPPLAAIEHVILKPGNLKKAMDQRPPAHEAQLDRRTNEKLRKGKLPIDGTLDLHGLSQIGARSALIDFVTAAQGRGSRCVLVVTGKGLSRRTSDEWMDAAPGILKQRLPEWLKEPPLNRLVLKSHPAQPAHGGGGAFYLYLKRDR